MIRRFIAAVAVLALIVCESILLYSYLLSKRARFIVGTTYQLTQQKRIPTVEDIRLRFGS